MEPKYWTEDDVKATLPIRDAKGHKGTYGTALLLAGSDDMPGAALLAGLGAMRSGLGKLVIGTSASVIPLIVPVLPEATYWRDGWANVTEDTAEEGYRAIAIGPGLEASETVNKAIELLLKGNQPLVLDAGALSERSYPKRKAPIVLTPHPGEFSRITGMEIKELQQDRVGSATHWAKKLGVTIVLKGEETVIAFPDGDCRKNPTGNAALAKGGTGDTLTGMLLGMLCCHSNPKTAVLNAVYLHGACAAKWTENRSNHTMLAHQLTDVLPEVWKQFEE
ncbi:NAD(P)H-hydrate dehydratase [Bacillus gobiensis]|uniref:NAD(P)H-hydrate dehydratase n=1 Tax=Bacillus gobiensis TaxID=1441095 RepID=UPI003D1C02F8